MKGMDEVCMYLSERPAWIAMASELMAERIANGTYTREQLTYAWGAMKRDYQKATWLRLSDESRALIKSIRLVDTDAKRAAK